HWLHVNKPPTAACTPTTNPGGKNIPGQNASPKAGQNPDGYYQLLGVDPDSPAPAIFVGDTGSSFVAGPYAPGTKVKITQTPGADPLGRGAADGAGELLDARPAHAAQRAEAREELAALDGPDAGDLVQLRAQRAFRARLAMEADGEAVRLVAHALHELQDGRR